MNEAWGKAENDELNSEIDFGSEEDSDSKNQINKKWGELSTGKTNIALSDDVKNMTSTGTSKGKVLTTVTSAKTSAKNTDTDTRIDGSKKTAVGKLTAKSTVSIPVSKPTSTVYQGVTTHTATHDGILYEAATSDSAPW